MMWSRLSVALDFFQGHRERSYDLIILGDVLEHFCPEDAVSLIEKCVEHCSYLLVVVPFGSEQDECYGNKYERHLQPDLNFDTMEQRYGRYLELLMHGHHSSDDDYEIAVYHGTGGISE